MQKLRVLHVLGGLDRGGAETWFIQVLRRLVGGPYQMDVLVFSLEEGAYEQEAKALGAKVVRVSPPTNPVKFISQLQHAMTENGPYHIVHSHIWLASGMVMYAAKRAGVRCRIAHSRTTSDWHRKNWARKVYERVMRLMINRYATMIVAITEAAGVSLFGSKRWASAGQVIPTAIDCRPFARSIDQEVVRKELGIDRDAFVVGHVGRFVPQKNHKMVVDIFFEYSKLNPAAHLLLVGVGPLRDEVFKQVEQLGLSNRVTVLGSRDDISRLMMGAMDVFLFPSLWEGFGRVVIEAQAAGLPCVISDGIPDDVDVVPTMVKRLRLTDAPTEWARMLSELASQVPQLPKGVAFGIVESSRFNLEASARLIEQLYNEGVTSRA